MNPAQPEHPGTGGGLRYLTEEAAAGMVNQERSHSCQAACARQLLRDAGVDISEDGPDSGSGSVATIKLDDFFAHWHWTFFIGVIPVGRKVRTAP